MNILKFAHGFSCATLILMASLTTMTSCKSDSGEPGPGKPAGEISGKAGYLIGKVTDPQGNSLPRATVYTENTVVKGRGVEVSSSTDGTYKIQLVKDLGQWNVRGHILKQYNGRVYKIQLEPDNTDSFTEDEKPVRNFQWKLTGHIPDLSLDLYYGGAMEMFRDLNANELYDNENIEFTLKPVGTLIDGSTGKILKLQAKKRYNDIIKDIPIGRYTVTAIYKPTGEQLMVRDAWGDDDNYVYKSAVTMDFLGTESAVRSNSMGIGFTNRK